MGGNCEQESKKLVVTGGAKHKRFLKDVLTMDLDSFVWTPLKACMGH